MKRLQHFLILAVAAVAVTAAFIISIGTVSVRVLEPWPSPFVAFLAFVLAVALLALLFEHQAVVRRRLIAWRSTMLDAGGLASAVS